MASIITVTRQTPDEDTSAEYDLKIKHEENEEIDKTFTSTINDFYDEALSKTDPDFLAPIRRWEKRTGFVTPIRWTSAILIFLFHALVILLFGYSLSISLPMWQSSIFAWLCGTIGGFGVTCGAHRYWTHRSFKAKLPLQIILIICFSLSGQNNIRNWVRDHRVHHKMSETSADPHDASRGFFFSHVGWLMMKKHPHVIREGNKIDMSDILNDPLIQFQTKYFNIMKLLLCFILPTIIPKLFWGETWNYSVSLTLLRYMLNLHFTWAVNSFAHLWGNKPYDINIMPTENWKVSIAAMGEGWHNYHHTFPWDYKAAELAYFLNITTYFIDGFAYIGWAYDLKKASPVLIKAVQRKRGPESKHK